MNAKQRKKDRAACKREGHGWKGEGKNRLCWRCGLRKNKPTPKAGVRRVEALEARVELLERALAAVVATGVE